MEKYLKAVDKHTEKILEAEKYLWAHPETGFKEFETGKYMEDAFEALGYDLCRAGNIPGFYTVLDTGRPGPEILVFGELDSVICPEHPDANPETGAVHACGHNAQCAALIGLAAALKEPGVLDEMCGRIRLCAVPAEELLELEFRTELKKKGIIKYFGGKTEFLARGYFDGVDMAFMVHSANAFRVRKGSVGCIAKAVTYKGVAAHAGAAPWKGKNALYAATCGLNAVNAIRETFTEEDLIRVHPIITSGGAIVNAIPETVTLESYVRGATFEGICKENKKVNRALCGAALSLGNNIEICDIPGYAPLVNDVNLVEISVKAISLVAPSKPLERQEVMGTGCTDLGDISQVMPSVHPYAGGAEGRGHGNDFRIVDPIAACVDSAKWQLVMLHMLLSDNAKEAVRIIKEYKAPFKKEEYLAFMDSLNTSGDRIDYSDENYAKVLL